MKEKQLLIISLIRQYRLAYFCQKTMKEKKKKYATILPYYSFNKPNSNAYLYGFSEEYFRAFRFLTMIDCLYKCNRFRHMYVTDKLKKRKQQNISFGTALLLRRFRIVYCIGSQPICQILYLYSVLLIS